MKTRLKDFKPRLKIKKKNHFGLEIPAIDLKQPFFFLIWDKNGHYEIGQ